MGLGLALVMLPSHSWKAWSLPGTGSQLSAQGCSCPEVLGFEILSVSSSGELVEVGGWDCMGSAYPRQEGAGPDFSASLQDLKCYPDLAPHPWATLTPKALLALLLL